MPEIDFYTVKGEIINRYFELGLDYDVYYRWDTVVDKVEEKIGSEEDKDKKAGLQEKRGVLMML